MVRTCPPRRPCAAGRLPDFLLVGAPKAGTTALHAALAQHPELFLSGVKEPKYYLCGDSPPPAYRGPGDAHSSQEWIWQRQRLPRPVPGRRPRTVAGGEHAVLPLPPRRPAPDRRRPAARQADCGAARPGGPGLLQLDAPVGRRPRAVRRRRRGCARRPSGSTTAGRRSGTTGGSGCTASSWPTSSSRSRASRCSCCATARWSTSPTALNRVARFLGIAEDVVAESRRTTRGRSCTDGSGPRLLGPVVRAGAKAGAVPSAAGLAPGQQAADRAAAPARIAARPEAHPRATREALVRAVPRGHRAARGDRRVLRGLAHPPRRRLVPHRVAAGSAAAG